MRRQRTSSEASNNDDHDEEQERISEVETDEQRTEDVEMEEAGVSDSSTEESENEESEDNDSNEDNEDESDYDGMDSDMDTDMASVHFDIMNQLQSALFGGAGISVNMDDLERLRRSFPFATAGNATHSNRIRSIIRSLPVNSVETDPMLLYSAFTELWELIVLTGEEVEAYEFDTVVDLKPLLGHLLRVLTWKEDCQVYGSEFLLYAIRCTRACVQYSPGCARRLVESGLVPLITQQLFSVEYIDLAEDSIQIIQLLSKIGTHSRACLHADGIKAVLGFVDFFSLSVQVNAFTATAQMATALTDDTLELYLPGDIIALLRSTIRRAGSESNDAQVVKIIHQAAQTLINALKVAPEHAEALFPADFLVETVLPQLSPLLPADSASMILRLASTGKLPLHPSTHNDLLFGFLKTLLGKSAANESLLQDTLKIVIELYCRPYAQKSLKGLISLCMKTRSVDSEIVNENESIANTPPVPPSDLLFEFYLNSPSISVSMRHLTLVTLLLLDDVSAHTNTSVSLEKMALLSKLLTELKDPLALVIGLEWFRILSRPANEEFIQTATRQGLPAELESLKNFNGTAGSTELEKWIESRLDEKGENVYEIYIRHLATDCLKGAFESQGSKSTNCNFTTVEELIRAIEGGATFTEYEWLGDPQNCIAKKLLNLSNSFSGLPPLKFKPICEAIYKALNRYDNVFTVAVPRQARLNPADPFASLSLLDRPVRVTVRTCTSSAPAKTFICDPLTQIGWLVKLATCGSEEEMKFIMRYSGMGGISEDEWEVISDANSNIPDTPYGVVNISSQAFSSSLKKSVTLQLSDSGSVPLKPSQSVIEVLFEAKLKSAGDDAWKRINELWSGNIIINIKEISEDTVNVSDDISMSNETYLSHNSRIKLALELLDKIPFKRPNETLNSKLSKELDSVLLTVINGISPHWIRAAQEFPFLFDFNLRVNLMRSVCLGPFRALTFLHYRLLGSNTPNNPNQGSAPSIPRHKFRIDRANFMKCLRHVFAPVNDGDFRSFEFEYIDELGTGHGPTMEFYALASKEICRPSLGLMHVTRPGNLEADEIIEAEGEGLFPSWTAEDNNNAELFRILGSLVARALLDDRIIDIPLHPIFLTNESVQFKDFKFIDSELFAVLSDETKIVGNGITFNVPGTEIQLIPGQERTINNLVDLEEFQGLLMKRINEKLTCARDSFLQGFNSTFPVSFEVMSSFIPLFDLVRLIGPSRFSSDSDWSVPAIRSALITDHGYRPDSPQITWLAELLSEAPGNSERTKLVRFLTGAAYLPVGGWGSLRPPLTIVCKTFSTEDPGNESSASLTSSSNAENHDAYLPSVMTCANYLKLPRYSSKQIMKERLEYAVREGCGSFYLS